MSTIYRLISALCFPGVLAATRGALRNVPGAWTMESPVTPATVTGVPAGRPAAGAMIFLSMITTERMV